MAAYFIVDVNVENPQGYEEYRVQVQPTLDLYGGHFIARGGAIETIEGDWHPQRLVIIEFTDTDQFKRWYDSPEYSTIREIRFKNAKAKAILIQGV